MPGDETGYKRRRQPAALMSDFRPRSNSEILDASFEIYRRHFSVFVAISVFAAIPGAISAYIAEPALALQRTGGLFNSALVSSLVLFIAPFTEGAMTSAASSAYLGRRVDFEQSVRNAFSHAGWLFVAMVRKWLLLLFGLVFFVVPGLVIFKRYFALPMTVLFEDNTAGAAIARSRHLSNGNGRRIFSLNGGVFLFSMLVMLTLQQAITSFTHGAISAVGQLAVNAAVSPFGTIVATLLYYDIRIRREGYDIELMTQALDADSPVLNPAP
jgi:hypothetical protein